MKRASKTTYETVRRIGLALPGATEGTSYGTPALKVKGKLFARMWEDGETMVVKMSFADREELMAADPQTYFITDHYKEYEYMLVRLPKVSEAALRDLLLESYRAALPKKRNRGKISD